MSQSHRTRRTAILIASVTALLGSAPIWLEPRSSADEHAAIVGKEETLANHLEAILQSQAAAWNKGDIPSFMSAYWNDPRLTFSSGGETQRGWIATRDRYLKRYPDRTAMGTLKFTHLETESLSENAAIMLGQWHLEKDKPAEGNFTLVWKKIDGKWLIIHDHSSSRQP